MRKHQKDLLLCILSSILLILSFPKLDYSFLAWFALVPWFFALRNQPSKRAFLLSYLVGLVFFSGIVWWVNHVSGLGFSILVLYLALYFGVFGLVFSAFSFQLSAFSFFVLPCVWVTLEYIRSHLFTGFSWALLGYSQYRVLPVIQISDITGAYGVSFFIVLVNVGIWQALDRLQITACPGECNRQARDYRLQKKDLFSVLCSLFSVLLVLGYGYFKLSHRPEGEKIKVAVIQGNIPQRQKWDPDAREYILEKYFRLTKQSALAEPNIIIWPETSVPGFLEDEQELLQRVSSLSKEVSPAYLLVGTPQVGSGRKIYNSANLLLQGEIIQRYSKLHLVPFGEFIPCPQLFSRFSFAELIGNFSPGEDYTVFSLVEIEPQVRLSALVCFEDVFAHLVRRFVQKGANVLVNMTNDAWFRDSSEPYQHLQASVFRAVENRVNLVRSANTGVSCFINPWGKILSRVLDDSGRDVLVAGERAEQLEIVPLSSFYTAYGDIFAWLCLLVTVIFLLARCLLLRIR